MDPCVFNSKSAVAMETPSQMPLQLWPIKPVWLKSTRIGKVLSSLLSFWSGFVSLFRHFRSERNFFKSGSSPHNRTLQREKLQEPSRHSRGEDSRVKAPVKFDQLINPQKMICCGDAAPTSLPTPDFISPSFSLHSLSWKMNI